MENTRSKTTREFQIASDLRRRIESNEWGPGERMPPARELSEQYGSCGVLVISRVTNILRTWGLVITRPRQGMFRRPPRTSRKLIPGTSEYTNQIVSSEWVPAFSWIAEELNVDTDTMVYRTRWKVSSDNAMWCLVDLFTVEEAVTEVPDPYSKADRIRVTLPNEEEAEILGMPPEVPVLLMLSKAGDTVIRRIVAGDRVEYRVG